MGKVKLILVGGFLGAGKTTLIAKAAADFIKQGKKVGIITNDQAVNLVDTNLLQQHGLSVQEVAGGCFCCRFIWEKSLKPAMPKLQPCHLLQPAIILNWP